MDEVYEKLRERLDMFPQGFPKTKNGVELEILEQLFSTDEAEIALSLRPYPEPVAVLAERMNRDESELGQTLYDMSKRGLILRPLYEKFYQEGIVASAKDRSVGGFRVIPVEKEIRDDREIQPYEQVSEIIEANTKFAVADCICRKEAGIMGDKCDKLLEACMTFGFGADYYIDNGLGREISKEEAKEVLLKAEEDGLVHCSSNHKGDKMFICNCCGCHCKALAYITKHDQPGLIAPSNYYALVDTDTCDGCETCIERCQINAIEMKDEVASITNNRCIGCGLCVSTCPTESISMVHKHPDALSHIFADDNDLTQARAKDTGKVYPFE